MLDEFSSTKLDSAPKASTASGAATAASPPPPTEVPSLDEDDFAKQLQAGMVDMLRELESNPEMAKQFEAMMAQVGGPGLEMGGDPASQPQEQQQKLASSSSSQSQNKASTAKGSAASQKPAAATGSAPSSEDAFQETIKRTMNRMKASSSSADAAVASGASPFEDDMMASLLKELQNSEGGEGGDDAFSKVLLGMMEQLTNKDILYEPMKELSTKFPAWFEEQTTGAKKGALGQAELDRYRDQQRLVGEIVARFERKGYSDDNTADREYIVERMQQVSGACPLCSTFVLTMLYRCKQQVHLLRNWWGIRTLHRR